MGTANRRLALALLAIALLRGDMYPDASNAKLPEAQQNLGIPVSLESFGARCDGTSDDAAAFAAATAWIAAGNGRVVGLPAATCATGQSVQLGNGRQRSTVLSAGAALGASGLSVASCTGIVSGDGVVVKLDFGTYKGTVTSACASGGFTVAPVLPVAAAAGNPVFTGDNSTYNGGGFRGFGGCMTTAEIAGGEQISTVKYIGAAAPATSLTASVPAGATSLTVASIAGFGGNGLGVPVGVALDNGRVWWTWVAETPDGVTVRVINEAPSVATAGAAVTIANNPVVRLDGPMLGPILEGICLDANNLAAVGLDARQPMSGKFRGPRGLTVINYTGLGYFIHAARTLIKHSTGLVNNDFELFTQAPQNQKTIGAWLAGTPDSATNDYLKVGFSRNTFYGGKLTQGGNDPTAAGLRVEYLDNNTFIKPFTNASGAGLGAGLYRQPSWQRDYFPNENVYIAPAFVGGVVDGTAGGDYRQMRPDYFLSYSTGDGEAIPLGAESGVTNDGRYFGVRQLRGQAISDQELLATASFTTGSNGARSIVTSGKYAYMVEGATAGSTVVDVVDISNPGLPTLVSQTTVGAGNPIGKAVLYAGYLFIPVNDGTNSIHIVDVSNPKTPVLTATIATGNAGAGALAVSGNFLFAGTRTGGIFRAWDISTPGLPRQVGTLTMSAVTRTTGIALQGKYAYVSQVGTTDKGLEVIDVSNPAALASTGSYDANDDVYNIVVSGKYAYLGAATAATGLHVVDISNPAAPVLATTLAVTSAPVSSTTGALTLAGRYLYFLGGPAASGLQIIDVSNPLAPFVQNTQSSGSSNPSDAVLSGDVLLLLVSGTTNNLRLYRASGTADLASASIGAVYADRVKVGGEAVFDKAVQVQGGISAGAAGIYSRGSIAAAGVTLTSGLAGARLSVACGTTAGTAKIVATAGSSSTPVTVLDNIGAGVGGC